MSDRDWFDVQLYRARVFLVVCLAVLAVTIVWVLFTSCDSGDTYYTSPTATDSTVVDTVWVDPGKPKCHDCHQTRYWAGIPYAVVECDH